MEYFYIETGAEINPPQLEAELKAAGVPAVGLAVGTRRVFVEDGVIEVGKNARPRVYPRAVTIKTTKPLNGAAKTKAKRVVRKHVAVWGWVPKRKREIKQEAKRRIVRRVAEEHHQRNDLAEAIRLIATALPSMKPKPRKRLREILDKWDKIGAVRAASDILEVQVETMTDEEAKAFKVRESSAWPTLQASDHQSVSSDNGSKEKGTSKGKGKGHSQGRAEAQGPAS